MTTRLCTKNLQHLFLILCFKNVYCNGVIMGGMPEFWMLITFGSHEESKLLRNVTCSWSLREADVFLRALPHKHVHSGIYKP